MSFRNFYFDECKKKKKKFQIKKKNIKVNKKKRKERKKNLKNEGMK